MFPNSKPISLFFWILTMFLLCGMASSCGTAKKLKTNQTFLRKNNIVLKSNTRIGGKRNLKYELSTIYKQQPNSRFLRLFKFRLWAYNKTQAKIQATGDTTKWNRWVMKTIAESPSVYNKKVADATAQSMQYYLQHKGYNDAIVTDTVKHNYRRKKSYVTYTAILNNIYQIDSVTFLSKDSAILSIMKQYREASFLKKGQPVSKSVFDKENDRFIKLLRNKGYANFNNSFFYSEGDSSNYNVNITYEILPPPRAKKHTVYQVGHITVIPDYSLPYNGSLIDTTIADITFLKRDTLMKVKAKTIIRNIFLKTGDLYQDDLFVKTNLQLRAFDIFKGINIRQSVSPDDPNVLDFVIEITQKKKMVVGADVELNNSNINSSSRISLLGITGSLNFRHRNLFRDAYLFLGELQGGVDLNLTDPTNLFYSIDLTAKGELYMPRFVDPVHMWGGLRKIRLIKSGFYQDLKEKGRSRISVIYDNLSLFQFYSYNSFNLSFGYNLQRDASNRYQINQFGVNYLITNIQPDFQEVLIDNPFLANSFNDQLFTGLFFKDFSYTYVGKTDRRGRSFYFQTGLELSGLEMFGINSLYNAIQSGEPDTFKLFKRVEFAQFASLSIDGRFYKTISPSQSFAARFTAGIARPFGFSKEVPYIKQFYVGGPYSIRAWSIRELGPGQYYNPNDTLANDNIPFYQTGDIKMEFSAEYRFDVFWMLESAFFIDVGNTWTIKEDTSRVGSQLLWSSKFNEDNKLIGKNFIDQLAIGTGIGIRGDFSYFIIRLDLGIKVRNPYPDPITGKHWRWNELRNGPFKDLNYNLAIGYPF
ncbi:MAG: outer membrane protein insertion porin family [Polaribacter sp.]|jgi:outer membrane protein insertion porin family